MSGSPSKSREVSDASCKCGGTGWIVVVKANDPRDTGTLVKCPGCTDYLVHSRLTDEERSHTLDDIKNRPDDTRGETYALRFLGKQMLSEPYGFLSIYGRKGGGKSLLLTALIAEFCRHHREAVYYNAGDIVTMLSAGDEREIDGIRLVGNYDTQKRRLKSIPVLAIDEIDKIKWSDWQVQHIGEVIEYRHRNADRLITLFAMNKPPWEWSNAGNVEHISSRFKDGRFHRQWPEAVKIPACLKGSRDVPGLFEVTLPDVRPTLRRY